jgi:SprT protein
MIKTEYMLDLVKNRVEKVQKKLASKGYPSFPIVSKVDSLKAGTAGIAHPLLRTITISKDYLRDNKEQVLKTTVAHEVCHLYVNMYFPRAKQHHGPEFRSLMNLLGLDGKTYHSMGIASGTVKRTRKVTRYVYKTADTGTIVKLTSQKHNKEQMYRKYYLGERGCYTLDGEPIVWTGKVVKQ